MGQASATMAGSSWMITAVLEQKNRLYALTGVEPTCLHLSEATKDALCAEALVRGLSQSTRGVTKIHGMRVVVDNSIKYGYVRFTHDEG